MKKPTEQYVEVFERPSLGLWKPEIRPYGKEDDKPEWNEGRLAFEVGGSGIEQIGSGDLVHDVQSVVRVSSK
jgi:hypothetical protein